MSSDGRASLLCRIREICDGVANCFRIKIDRSIEPDCPLNVEALFDGASSADTYGGGDVAAPRYPGRSAPKPELIVGIPVGGDFVLGR